jgi:uncharacterized membrane protein YphA (DoxX/SURF4 family)
MKENKTTGLMMFLIIMLGLLMLIPGLLKLFVYKPSGVSAMLSGIFLFSWAPMFWAGVLILGEIGSGIAILAKWRLKYTASIAAFIVAVAMFTSTINWVSIENTNWINLLLHLVAIANYLILALESKA